MNFAPTEEQKSVREMSGNCGNADQAIAAELDRTHRHPKNLPRLGEQGLMGVAVPTEYDGAGMDNVTYVMALIEISKACASCGPSPPSTTAFTVYPIKAFGRKSRSGSSLPPSRAARWKAAMHSRNRLPVPMPAPSSAVPSSRVTATSSTAPRCSSPMAMSPVLHPGGDDRSCSRLQRDHQPDHRP